MKGLFKIERVNGDINTDIIFAMTPEKIDCESFAKRLKQIFPILNDSDIERLKRGLEAIVEYDTTIAVFDLEVL